MACRLRSLAIAILLLLLSPVSLAASDCPKPAKLARARISVTGPASTAQFEVEVADTAPARVAGLMCRSALAEGTGMLFVYPRAQTARMWMKNTYISLDMLFATADGRIVKIATDMVPGKTQRIESGTAVTQVLELPAGSAARHGIRVGDRIRREE